MIREINRGEGITQLIEWPEEMEVKRIHVRKLRKDTSDRDEAILISAIIMAVIGLLFGTVLLQYEAVYIVYWLITIALIFYSAHAVGLRENYRHKKNR